MDPQPQAISWRSEAKRNVESWSKAMARVCALTGKKVQYGHNVSHSKRATNRRFEPNIQKVRLLSEALGQQVPLNIAARTLRTVQKKGGLDGFLLSTDDTKLQAGALRLKNKIRRKLSGRPPQALRSIGEAAAPAAHLSQSSQSGRSVLSRVVARR